MSCLKTKHDPFEANTNMRTRCCNTVAGYILVRTTVILVAPVGTVGVPVAPVDALDAFPAGGALELDGRAVSVCSEQNGKNMLKRKPHLRNQWTARAIRKTRQSILKNVTDNYVCAIGKRSVNDFISVRDFAIISNFCRELDGITRISVLNGLNLVMLVCFQLLLKV